MIHRPLVTITREQRRLAERVEHAPAHQPLPGEADRGDRQREPEPRVGEDAPRVAERRAGARERRRREQLERVAPLERDQHDVDEPHERRPHGRHEQVLDDRVEVLVDARAQARRDRDVDRVVGQRHRRHGHAGDRAVRALRRRELPARAPACVQDGLSKPFAASGLASTAEESGAATATGAAASRAIAASSAAAKRGGARRSPRRVVENAASSRGTSTSTWTASTRPRWSRIRQRPVSNSSSRSRSSRSCGIEVEQLERALGLALGAQPEHERGADQVLERRASVEQRVARPAASR